MSLFLIKRGWLDDEDLCQALTHDEDESDLLHDQNVDEVHQNQRESLPPETDSPVKHGFTDEIKSIKSSRIQI